jgi:DNA sulfur modification protein DndD
VHIDPEAFKVELRRWDGADLPRERLSAGEKQLLAISLLWALAKVSDRPLPVVIDTPLARLDRHHRDRQLTEYFPSVSHQVIVLSTDTEVDAEAAAELEPFISRAYELVHDVDECRTSVRDGYFADEAEAIDAR